VPLPALSVRLGVTAVLAALALALAAADAPAAPKKPFTLTITSTSPPVAAGQQSTVTLRLTNIANPQSLGSANITVPSGFGIVSVSSDTGNVTVSGNVIQLRYMSLPPGGSVLVTSVLEVPCAPGTHTWRVAAKQANNFNGRGNDFGLKSLLPTTTVPADPGVARLQFVSQPGDAAPGARITAVDFQPDSTQLVTVRAVDACGRL
jgi:hypothetical protein